MPHSLRAKLKGLNYKKLITDRELERLCKALDNEDVLDKIRAEIAELETYYDNDYFSGNRDAMFKYNDVMQIIDHYMKGE